jgi:cytochrome c-type biogenesis protein CcmF
VTAELGNALVLAGLACAAAGMVTGFSAGFSRSLEGWRMARRFAYGFCACMILATGAMWYALITHDFSVKYVTQVGSLATPLWIDIVSLWSSLEGSILFWGFVLSLYIIGCLTSNGDKNHETMPFATGVFCAVGTFFALLLAGPANPFLPSPSPVPLDGPGPNPLLQNHILMVIHPPALYLGYVGMTIPFGLAVGALLRGQLGATQMAPLRNWLLIPWTFLTAGIVLGGWWAYEVLGWGGYWAWDPVENASLLPWLTATAALHAMMLPGRRGSMKGWTLSLVVATFLLTLLGTFMTRSGVFNSVHSFSQSDIGPTFLVFIAINLLACVVLLAMRVDRIEGEGAVKAVVSREAAFLVNNLLFVVLTFTVLIGTTFPLITEAIKGTKLSVGQPYFNQMAVPTGVVILFLMGVGPSLPWGRPSGEQIRKLFIPPALTAIAALAIGLSLGLREPWPLATLACAGFSAYVTLRELIHPITARMADYREPFPQALPRAFFRNRRRFGGYIVHGGIIVMILAIAMSSAYRVDKQVTLKPGESAEFQGYTLTYQGPRFEEQPNRSLTIGDVQVTKGGSSFLLSPALTTYPRMGSPIGTPAVRTGATHDLYLSLMNLSREEAGIHAYYTPGVGWLWAGAGIVLLGSLIAGWPGRRRTEEVVMVSSGAAQAELG